MGAWTNHIWFVIHHRCDGWVTSSSIPCHPKHLPLLRRKTCAARPISLNKQTPSSPASAQPEPLAPILLQSAPGGFGNLEKTHLILHVRGLRELVEVWKGLRLKKRLQSEAMKGGLGLPSLLRFTQEQVRRTCTESATRRIHHIAGSGVHGVVADAGSSGSSRTAFSLKWLNWVEVKVYIGVHYSGQIAPGCELMWKSLRTLFLCKAHRRHLAIDACVIRFWMCELRWIFFSTFWFVWSLPPFGYCRLCDLLLDMN